MESIFSKKNNELEKMEVFIDFYKNGTVKRMVLQGLGEDSGSISKADAIQIALKEIRSGKYDVPEFLDKDVDVYVDLMYEDSRLIYNIFINNIPLERRFMMGVTAKIDSNTGEIISIEF